MKKLYTLLAALLLTITASAQTIGVTVDGKAVQDGDNVVLNYLSIKNEVIPGVLVFYNIEPEIFVQSTVAQEMTVEVEDLDKQEGQAQNCFTSCITCKASNNYIVSQTKTVTSNYNENARIHINYNNVDPGSITRKLRIKASTASEKIEFVLTVNVGDNAANVNGVAADKANAPVYTIGGARVNNALAPGIYVKDGKKFMVK